MNKGENHKMKKPCCINVIQLDLNKLPLSQVKNQGQPCIVILCPIFKGLGEVDTANSISIFVCGDAKIIERVQKCSNVPILNIQQYWKRNKSAQNIQIKERIVLEILDLGGKVIFRSKIF